MTQTVAMLLAFLLAALTLTHTVQVWQVLVIAFALGCSSAVDMPTRQAFVIEMVGREDIGNAVALNSAIFNAARIIGPAVAGIAIGVFDIGVAFLINGLSFLAVIGSLLAMRPEELRPAVMVAVPKTVRAVVANLAEGLTYVRRTPVVLLAVGDGRARVDRRDELRGRDPGVRQERPGHRRRRLRVPHGRIRGRLAASRP